jgi:hypothetical protein
MKMFAETEQFSLTDIKEALQTYLIYNCFVA